MKLKEIGGNLTQQDTRRQQGETNETKPSTPWKAEAGSLFLRVFQFQIKQIFNKTCKDSVVFFVLKWILNKIYQSSFHGSLATSKTSINLLDWYHSSKNQGPPKQNKSNCRRVGEVLRIIYHVTTFDHLRYYLSRSKNLFPLHPILQNNILSRARLHHHPKNGTKQ